MKAVVCTRYGGPEVLQLQEVATPSPAPDELLVRIRATTAHVGDTRIRGFKVPAAAWLFARLYLGIFRPRRPILGMELAGDVEAVGDSVTHFAPGDRVVAFTGFRFGAYAEYRCLPGSGSGRAGEVVAHLPDDVSYEDGAALPGGGLTALLVLRKADIQPGAKVLIYGASGSVGTYAVQLAKHHFRAQVTAVCSTANLDLVRSLGADTALDYTCDDFDPGGPYDVVFDAVDKMRRVPSGGLHLNVDKSSNGIKITCDDLRLLMEMLNEGTLQVVVDRSYPLEELVAAHRYVDRGHKKGNVVVTVSPADVTAGS